MALNAVIGLFLIIAVQIPGKLSFNRVHKAGHISIGGLVSLHKEKSTNSCTRFYLPGLNRVEAIVHTVNKINNNSELLPNVTLGYDIRDYCNDRALAMKEAYDFVKSNIFGMDDLSTNAASVCRQCSDQLWNHSDSVVAVIGPFGSRNSLQVAGLLQVIGMAGISPSATSEELSWSYYDKFFRTVPPDNLQARAMADLIDRFNWNYVAAVAVEHSYGLYGIRALEREAMERKTFCIGFTEYVAPTDYQRQLIKIVERLKRESNVKVVVLWIEDRIAKDLMREAEKQKVHFRIWIMSDSLATKTPEFLGSDFIYLGVYLGIQPKQYRDIDYENHLMEMTVKKSLQSTNRFWETFWKQEFGCIATVDASIPGACPENLTMTKAIFNKLYDDFIPYQVDAVYAVAHVLNNIYRCKNNRGLLKNGACPPTTPSIDPKHVLLYLRNVSFQGLSGHVQFDRNGDPLSSSYDIISFQKSDTAAGVRYTKVRVGTWIGTRVRRLNILNNTIDWNTGNKGAPESFCTHTCPPGTVQTNTVACCWECLQCPDGTMTNSHGARNCTSCTIMQRSSDDRTTCVNLPIITLEWSDITAIIITATASVGLLFCLCVMIIFSRYRLTPIVKASNRELSFVVLVTIVFCFILTFLHIARPSDAICSLVEPWRYVSFTICVSVLVLKTIRILRAFDTRPIVQWINKNFIFDTKKQLFVVVVINAPQIILSALWKSIDRPSVKKEIVTKVSVLLSCQLYKTTAGFTLHMCMVAYLVMWSIFCAYYAFKARNLPENFNEAKYIGFSMYILLLSWITYFPVQYTLDGWYVSVVSCATILVSSYGFLICIFAPKVYVIVFHPERNTHEFVRSTMRQNKNSGVEPATNMGCQAASPMDTKYTAENSQT